MQGLRLKGAQGFVPIKTCIFISPCTILQNRPLSWPPPIPLCGTYPKGSVSLGSQVASLPYSTAITDSLDSQVTHVPLRIQFTGVTQVRLPPLFRGQNFPSLFFHSHHMGAMPSAHSVPRSTSRPPPPNSKTPVNPFHRGLLCTAGETA